MLSVAWALESKKKLGPQIVEESLYVGIYMYITEKNDVYMYIHILYYHMNIYIYISIYIYIVLGH